jgi:16S rRNA (cytidine1402-2'-O)-methyltransferase
MMVAWPSGKAEACKASIPSSNLGATSLFFPMLHLIATTIGNLKDITYRAIEALQTVDLILCEDTRHSQRLLQHYGISKPCLSLHKFNEASQIGSIIASLKEGKNIALISDAGTPGIADPGETLVARCAQENIPITALPGPCAAITALSCSGLATSHFQFCGFLPRKEGELKRALMQILEYTGTSICYESPRRINDTLECLAVLAPDRHIALARELTKMHETIYRGTTADIYATFCDTTTKGEMVLLIAGQTKSTLDLTLTPEEHVAYIESTFKVSKKEAIKITATQYGLNKRELYRQTLCDKHTPDE